IRVIDYDAIVADIKMPGMDGLALLAEIRTLRPDTPTVLITGHGHDDLAVLALRGGAYDFVQKPIDRDYIVASLTRAIEERERRRRVEAQQAFLEQHAELLEKIVEERTRELREANRLKDQFMAMLSHELRSPLGAIRMWASLLRGGKLDAARTARAIEAIERSAITQAQLVEELLDMSRITAGKLVLDARPVDLAAVAEAALDAVRADAEAKEVRVERVSELGAESVQGDAARLQQIMWNLLSNAVKFSPRGGRVLLRLARADGQAIISARDATQPALSGGEFHPSPSLRGVRVLLVDDDAGARASVAAVLEQSGAIVRAVESVAGAVETLEQEPPDVLISDIAMTRADG